MIQIIRKTMVRLDNETIPESVIQKLNSNKKFKNFSENIYIFEFDDVEFSHALELLGKNPNRFGSDLQDYLNGALFRLGKIPTNPYVTIDFGTQDFKRRASEDFGVGFSSLFMVELFNLGWESISQIPRNKNISKFADFMAISGNDTHIFESKGTTQAHKISEVMNKAIEQAKSHGNSMASKFAFVSYFPNNKKNFPPFMFISDPPLTEDSFMNKEYTLMLHYKNVLEYSQFKDTMQKFINLLKQKIRIDLLEKDVYILKLEREKNKFERLKGDLNGTFEKDFEKLDKMKYNDLEFVGKYIKQERGELSIKLFMGIETKILRKIMGLQTDIKFLENGFFENGERKTSIFSDGTIFDVLVK